MLKIKNKLIVILGPTSSGKTGISVKLAKKFGGEIVSADSRQVYKDLDIGSGKIMKREMRGVPHHLLDVENPKRKFSVSQYQKLALKKIHDIQKRGHVPFLIGGTGFYIQSVIDGIIIPEVKPNWKLRKKLAQKSAGDLFLMLKKLDLKRAKSIDPKNPRRLVRAIEITDSGILPSKFEQGRIPPKFDVLEIGIKKSKKEVKHAIRKRLIKRLNQGMVTEVRKLRKNGLSFRRLEELGLEYRCIAQYLQQKITYQEMIEKIQKESEHFASRQMTWFKRDKRIHWIRNRAQVEKIVKKFLKKKSPQA